jgi:TrmH family RNA methyltransferase
MQIITSVQNYKIQQVCKLHDSKARAKQQLFLAEGIRTIETLLLQIESQANTCTNLTLAQLFITPEVWGNCPDSIKNLPDSLITLVSQQVSAKISTTSTSSGILAVFEIPKYPLAILQDNLSNNLTQNLYTSNLSTGIVLVDLNNPGNLGTLIRTAAALNLETVVTIAGTDPWSPKVVQASAGTIGKVKIYELSWPELLTVKQDLKLCALTPDAKLNLLAPENRQIIKNNLLVIGNEAHGIPEEYLATCDYQFSLPMPGNTESLNAAIAGAIAMYLGTQ